uniref:MYND-type domain-containing protein n=1 Tax=Anopheles farauti TaxID=69004 RepID=A0A182Q988_9DIPT
MPRTGRGENLSTHDFIGHRKFLPAVFLARLNKRSMHGMEASGDALVVCSDTKIHNLPTNLKPFLALPKEHSQQQQPLKVQKLPSTSVLPQESDSSSKSVYVTTTIGDASSTDGQSETKEPAGDRQDLAEAQATSDDGAVPAAADTVEKSSDAITSTTPSTGAAPAAEAATDNMPTATAVEVSEKIADSSDDAVSMLSSATSTKKTVTATTPTVNSSASTEPAEQKAAEQNASDTAKESAPGAGGEGVPSQENSSTINQEPPVDDKRTKRSSPSPNVAIAEPTADDVMAGIDDFMDQNGSEAADEEEGKSGEKDFNEDLTFQMDVDEPVGESSSGPTKSPPPPVAQRAEVSAIDLSSVSEQSKAQSRKSVSPGASNESTTSAVAAPPPATKETDVDMHDKTVVTSTPDPKKAPSKRTERGEEQEAGSSSLEVVKCEREDAGDTGGEQQAENLSKQKPTTGGVRDGGSLNLSRKTSQPETVNRKRRRSVETEEERQAAAEQDEPVEPAKKLKLEVEANYHAHDRVVNEYIETTQNTSVDEIQTHTDALVKEIQTLNDMIRDTELQWNNLIHLKKVKEEILLRLNRRKHVIGITDTRLGEVSVYSHLDSSNLSSQHHHHQQTGRSSSVGPRPPTPPPEVEIRPASVTNNMHYGHGSSSHTGGSTATNGNSMISNRRSSSSSVQTSATTTGKRSAKDTNSFVSQFNSSNNAVTMVPLSSTTSMILNARASMNTAEVAKEKAAAVQIQRHILPKPVLSNHQQILNNLAMSAGLTGASGSSTTALLNGHHNPSGSNASQQQQQLQIGRQGMRKDVSSIIADYRQKHPENVPRRGRRLKNVGGGGGSSAGNNGTSTFGEGGAISLTALSGGKSPGNARPNSTDSVANRISELLAAAETSRPSSNDSSQSSSNLLTSLVSASGAANSSQQFFKDVLAQFAKMSQNEQNLLSNLQLLSNNATTTNTVSSPQQSPQQQQQQHHHHQSGSGALHQQQSSSTLFSKTSLPEVTLHPVMNSTAHSDVLGGGGGGGGNTSAHGNGSLTGANLSAVNSSTNSLLHGILTKSASRPGSSAAAAAAAAAAAVGNINTFSPTLARLLTGPERMNTQASGASSSTSTVTSGALANLQTNSITGGLNLSKNINEISITPVVGSNFQQTLLAQQQQQQQLQRLREQHLFKGESYLNLDDEADDSVDRLVIDEGDDMGQRGDSLHGSKRRGAEINENEVPQCQGCKKQEAKFVCAGCGNQWYCSRACQVNAWDDHSEVCSG